METLEELKNTYKKLKEESNNLYNKIKALENQDKISKFTVGECYLDTRQDNLIKIVSIHDNYIYYICLDDSNISRKHNLKDCLDANCGKDSFKDWKSVEVE